MLGKPRQLVGFPHMSMYIQEEKLLLDNYILIYIWYKWIHHFTMHFTNCTCNYNSMKGKTIQNGTKLRVFFSRWDIISSVYNLENSTLFFAWCILLGSCFHRFLSLTKGVFLYISQLIWSLMNYLHIFITMQVYQQSALFKGNQKAA